LNQDPVFEMASIGIFKTKAGFDQVNSRRQSSLAETALTLAMMPLSFYIDHMDFAGMQGSTAASTQTKNNFVLKGAMLLPCYF